METMVAGVVRSLERSAWDKPEYPLVSVHVALSGGHGSVRMDMPRDAARAYMIDDVVTVTIRPCVTAEPCALDGRHGAHPGGCETAGI